MIGVVGDDTTGALDIGVMFHRAGCGVCVLTAPVTGPGTPADVLIIDTDSRLDARHDAYAKVAAATRVLRAAGCTRFHKKTCSVFRGNVGAELDAMLDTLGAGTAVIAAAYPELGRTTRDGRQYLHGRPLEQSALARDPVHPRITSDLCAMIREQSDRSCAVVPLATVRSSPAALRQRLEELARHHSYLVVDGETQDDLRTLAEAARGFTVFGGSAGFAAVWPHCLETPPARTGAVAWPAPGSGGVLYVAGSLTAQTRRQTECLRQTGVCTLTLDPGLLVAGGSSARDGWLRDTSRAAVRRLLAGESVQVTTMQDPAHVRSAQAAAAEAGLAAAAFGRQVSGLLADLAAAILEVAPPAALVVAGGDTSGAVSRRLGIVRNHLLEELEPGIPLCVSARPGGPLLTVFKSGSFGAGDFLVRAGQRILQRQGQPATA